MSNGCSRTLGGRGSGCLLARLGGREPASDVDLVVVSGLNLNEAEPEAVVADFVLISGPGVRGRSVELTVVVQSEVRPWGYGRAGDASDLLGSTQCFPGCMKPDS